MANENITLVNNTDADIRDFEGYFIDSVNNGSPLPEEIADLFTLEVLEGYNPDGSNRGIVDWM